MVYPGCDAGIVDMQVERLEYQRAVGSEAMERAWVLFPYATDKEEADWAIEIMEAINQQWMDDRGNEP